MPAYVVGGAEIAKYSALSASTVYVLRPRLYDLRHDVTRDPAPAGIVGEVLRSRRRWIAWNCSPIRVPVSNHIGYG